MKWVIVAAVAAVLGCVVGAGAAGAATTRWNVRAVLSVSYRNQVTAVPEARCPAQYAETVKGVRATFSSTKPIVYDPNAHNFSGTLKGHVAGTWSVTGSYVAQVGQPDGTLGCATTPTPVACHAAVAFGDDPGAPFRLAVDDNVKGAVVSRVDAPVITERNADADAGAPPKSWPDVCTTAPQDEAIPAAPLFGLSATSLADRALKVPLRFPTSKLRKHTKFTVTGQPEHPNGCPAEGFDPCVESGSAKVVVTVTPATR